jgi:hypothetical protein
MPADHPKRKGSNYFVDAFRPGRRSSADSITIPSTARSTRIDAHRRQAMRRYRPTGECVRGKLDLHQCDPSAVHEKSVHRRQRRIRMDTSDMLFLGLVFVAFAAFFVTVMWVLHDDVRNRAARAARGANANQKTSVEARAA